MNRRATHIIIAIISFIVLAAAAYHFQPSQPKTNKPAAKTVTPAAKSAELHPLQIEAIRARDYPGSDITVEQASGNRGGYSDQIVSYRSDGLNINALMSTPLSSKPASGWPVIILDHGYIDPAQYKTDGSDYRSYIAAFTGAGYMVVKPDYRGNGQSEGEPEGGHYSPVYAYDNLNLIASLKRYDQVDAKRIGLFGHSLGGHVALRTIVVSKDVKATVFMSGVVGSFDDLFTNWPRSPARNDRPTGLVRSKLQGLVDQYGTPTTNPDFWNSASAITYVKSVTGAVQIHHSVGDSTVPKLFSEHLNSELKAVGKTVEYYEYPGDDHQFSQNQSLLLQRAVAFYQSHL